jgi:phosphohistidine phosphatase
VALGRWLAEAGYRPEEVIVSGALRTVETWGGMGPAFVPEVTARAERRLYDAPAERMLEVLRAATRSPLLLIGHNPGIGAFANRLAIAPPANPRFEDYPTGATTVLEFDAETWTDVAWHSGNMRGFMVPRDAS